MVAHVRWQSTGEAEIVLVEDDRVELRSTTPFAPGFRPKGELAHDGPSEEIWVKVHRSMREQDGRFHVWGRLLNMTRALRTELALLCPTAAAPARSAASPIGTPNPVAAAPAPAGALGTAAASANPVVPVGSVSPATPPSRW